MRKIISAILSISMSVFLLPPLALAAPSAPAWFTVVPSQTGNTMSITWVNSLTGLLNYTLERKTTGAATWGQIATVDPTVTVYYDTAGLTAGTSYDYQLKACVATGCTVYASESGIMLSSAGSGGSTSGTGSGVSNQIPNPPTNFTAALSTNSIAINLSWQYTSESTHYYLEKSANNGGTWSVVSNPSPATTVMAVGTTGYYTDNSGISTGMVYQYRLQACRSGAGCSSYVLSEVVTRDSVAPVLPTAIGGSINDLGKVHIVWSTATDNISIYGYQIFRNGVAIASATSTDYTDSNVTPGTTYNYYVHAYDAAQNRSNQSGIFTITVPASADPSTPVAGGNGSTETTVSPTTPTSVSQTDTTPPTAPTGLVATANELGEVRLYWKASTDNTAIKGYKIFRNDLSIAAVSTLTYLDRTTTPGETYRYFVVALDDSGNPSGPSNTLTVRTPPASGTTITSTPTVATTASTTVILPGSDQGYLRGVVKDNEGNPLPGIIYRFWNAAGKNLYIPTDQAGTFYISLPAADYKYEVVIPASRVDLIKPQPGFITITANEINYLSDIIQKPVPADKTISVKVKYPDGTDADAYKAVAYNSATNKWINETVDANGSLTLSVSPGSWQVAIHPLNEAQSKWVWEETAKTVTFSTAALSETKEVAFKVRPSGITISVSVQDPGGNPVEGAGVGLENTANTAMGAIYNKTDATGKTAFWVKSGKYLLRGYSPKDNLLNPDDITITADVGQKNEVVFILKAKTEARAVINGVVRLPDGNPAQNAKVWGWSDLGNFGSAETDSQGNFSMSSLPNDNWHLGSAVVIGGFPYRSAETKVTVKGLTAGITMLLTKFAEQISQPVTVVQASDQPIVAVSDTGASVYVPANTATSTPGSDVSVSIKAEADTPSRPNSRVVGNSYDVTIVDKLGNELKQFASDLEITLPYTDKTLKSLGISESTIAPVFFDELTKAWVKISDYVLNKEKNTATVRVKHLTRFALVAPADTVPPAAPTKIAYAVRVPGAVTLNWVNPTADFHHVKVYRSEKKTSTGTLLNDLVTGTSYKDAGLKKKTYYYTVKSVDASGNESKKNTAVAVNAAKVNVLTKVPTGLKLGSKGEGVKLLQQALKNAGDLSEDFTINGSFDKATLAALKIYQKRNKISATGTVGTKTATALNKLLK